MVIEGGPLQTHRTLYVVIPPSPLFAAHWSLFLPDLPFRNTDRQQENHLGRRIHVAGDRLHGFELKIVRRYDVGKHRGVSSRRFAIGLIPEQFLAELQSAVTEVAAGPKDEDEGDGYVDNSPVDQFEQTCIAVSPPGPSLVHVDAGSRGAMAPKKAEVKDCQWWVKQIVDVLSSNGMLVATSAEDHGTVEAPLEIVARLPVH